MRIDDVIGVRRGEAGVFSQQVVQPGGSGSPVSQNKDRGTWKFDVLDLPTIDQPLGQSTDRVIDAASGAQGNSERLAPVHRGTHGEKSQPSPEGHSLPDAKWSLA